MHCMTGPFDDPFDSSSTARKVLEHDRRMRDMLKSLGGTDTTPLALQAVRQREQIDAAFKGLGGVEGLRQHMARAAEAQRAFASVFPPERLKVLQEGFARHTILASGVGRDLALLAQSAALTPNLFARLQDIPDTATMVNQGLLERQAELAVAIATGSRLDVAWASTTMPSVSIGALAELAAFTARVRSAPAAAEERTFEIAEQFGNYDDAFAAAETAAGEQEREAAYTKGGRNPTLVAFPSRAYPSVLVAAGWVADYLPPPPPTLAAGGVCGTATHDPADSATITAVEAHLRHFVDATLTRTIGDGWIRTHVPADKAAAWEFRQQASLAKGNPSFTPIHYADFQDLLDIIVRRDLWRDVFGPVFGPKPLFEATMTRLHAIRLELAHARPLTNTTRLRLEVEANAVFGWLGVLARHG